MPARPMFDQSLPGNSAPAASPAAQQDSPLASQLPVWDLLPAHTLLVRRRPASPPAPRPEGAEPQRAAGSAPTAVPAPRAAPAAAPDSFCEHCGAQVEQDSTFCTACGKKAS